MRITAVKHNEQTGEVAIQFSGGRPTLLAKALNVGHDENGQIINVLLDRLIPNCQQIEDSGWCIAGCYVSELTRTSMASRS